MMNTTYSDWNEFDPEDYGWRWYGKMTNIDHGLITCALKALEQMNIQPGSLKKVADVGTGPNLYPGMLLAPFVAPKSDSGQLELIEYSQSNLHYLRELFNGSTMSPPFYIWGEFEHFMAERSPLHRRTLKQLRDLAVIREGDVYTLPPETYDAISAFFVAESITDSMEECERAAASLLAAVKPGGLMIAGYMLRSEGYPAGTGTRFPGIALTTEDLQRMYDGKLEDLTIVEPPYTPEVQEDYHGAAVVVGRRPRAARHARANIDAQEELATYSGQACLYDARRTTALKQAILQTVRPGDVVVDAGAGTGVLGMFAVQAGASKVYCVELSEEYVQLAKENVRKNGMQDKIIVLQGDAANIELSEPVDVIVSEVISAGFFYEPQLQIMKNLRRFLKQGGRTVPAATDMFVDLIDAQDELYGLLFHSDARYYALDDIPLTTRAKYLSANYLKDMSTSIKTKSIVRCITPGRANAIRITYMVWYSEGVLGTEPSETLLNPQMIFLPQPQHLQAGAYYKIALSYEAGSSPLTCAIAVEKEQQKHENGSGL